MNTYDRLIRDAERAPLSSALQSTLRVALAMGDEDFASWLRWELFGYSGENPAMKPGVMVPTYRTVGGDWFDEYGRRLANTNPRLGFMNETRVRPGVPELEKLVTAKGVLTIRDDNASIVNETLGVQVTQFRFPTSALEPVLANIRAQLLHQLAERQSRLRDVKQPASPAASEQIVLLRPSFYGIGIDLRALWRRLRSGRGVNHPPTTPDGGR